MTTAHMLVKGTAAVGNTIANSSVLHVGNSTVNTHISKGGIDTDGTLAVLKAATFSNTVTATGFINSATSVETAGNIKAGGLESYASPPTNNHITFANTTVTTTKSTGYDIGGQEVETFDFTENGIAPGQTFVYEKRGAPKTRGYPGFCLVSDGKDGTQLFTDNGPSNLQMSVTGDVHHDSGGSIFLFNDTSIENKLKVLFPFQKNLGVLFHEFSFLQ